jgi:hypothetical protein
MYFVASAISVKLFPRKAYKKICAPVPQRRDPLPSLSLRCCQELNLEGKERRAAYDPSAPFVQSNSCAHTDALPARAFGNKNIYEYSES